jgi:hypothetical protein
VFGTLIEPSLRSELQARVKAQYIRNVALQAQLSEIKPALSKIRVRPILLKGPSLWGWLYADPAVRRTRDLDLLISDKTELSILISNLKELGFSGNFESLEQAVYSNDHYELPTLFKNVVIDDQKISRGALSRHPSRMDTTSTGDGAYNIRVELELHKSFFLFDDGTYPDIPQSAVVEHDFIPGYCRLALAAQLPYIAAKFAIDLQGGVDSQPQAQSLKLLADFVRLIERASENEIAESIKLAKLWCCSSFYGRTMATAVPMFPDIEFSGLAHEAYSLDPLMMLPAQ